MKKIGLMINKEKRKKDIFTIKSYGNASVSSNLSNFPLS